jgi:hypothetical protein
MEIRWIHDGHLSSRAVEETIVSQHHHRKTPRVTTSSTPDIDDRLGTTANLDYDYAQTPKYKTKTMVSFFPSKTKSRALASQASLTSDILTEQNKREIDNKDQDYTLIRKGASQFPHIPARFVLFYPLLHYLGVSIV